MELSPNTGERRSPKAACRRVTVEFPEPLLAKTEEAASRLATNRSSFIRSAVEEYLAMLNRRHLERDLAAAYVANADFDVETCREFDYVDAEVL